MNQRLKCGEIFFDNEKISMDCLICDLTLYDNNDFVNHIQHHFLSSCSVNKSEIAAQDEPEELEGIFLTNEIEAEFKDVIFNCLVKDCQYSAETRKEILIHIFQNHKLIQRFESYYECSMCEAKYRKRDTVNRHLKLKHNFHTQLELSFMGSSFSSNQYKCSECKKVCLRLLDYNTHLRMSHKKYFNKLLADQQERFELRVPKSRTENDGDLSKLIKQTENDSPVLNEISQIKNIEGDVLNQVEVNSNELNSNQSATVSKEFKCLIKTCQHSSENKTDSFANLLGDHYLTLNQHHFLSSCSVNKSEIAAQDEPEELEGIFLTNEIEAEFKDVIFNCLVKDCQYSAETRKEILIHIFQNHELIQRFESYYECSMCEAKYSKRDTVNRHLKLKHYFHTQLELSFMGSSFSSNQYKCSECKKVCLRLLDYNTHLRMSHKKYFNKLLADQQERFELRVPKSQTENDGDLSKLIKQTENDSPVLSEISQIKNIEGDVLNQVAVNSNKLNSEEFKCLIKTCQYSSENKKDLFAHLLGDHYLTLNIGDHYQCAICESNYNTRISLVRHLKQDHGIILNLKFEIKNEIFKCSQCDGEFKTNLLLNFHLKKNHSIYYNETLADEIIKLQDSRNIGRESYIIPKPKPKNDARKLDLHTLKKLIVQLDNGLWKCLHCNETKDKRINIRVHVRNHFDRKMCEICGKLMKTKKYLLHMRTHTGEKPHQCEYCEKRFANYTNFRNHVRTHTGDKRHECDYCDQRFIQRTSKMTHMRVIHLKIQPFQCDICGKKLSTSGQLKTHILRNHTFETPFECEICNKKFRANYLLNHHKLLHSNPTPFECNLCDAKYALKNSLRMHRKKKHSFN